MVGRFSAEQFSMLAKNAGLTDAKIIEMAENVGIELTTFALKTYRRRTDTISPRIDTLKFFAEIFGCDINDFFDDGERQKLKMLRKIIKEPSEAVAKILKEAYPDATNGIIVPLLNHEASAGSGEGVFETEVIDTLLIDRCLLPIGGIYDAIKVRGNSMEPSLKDGDYVIINKNIDLNVDDIYVILHDGELKVKLLQFLGNKKLKIISTNKSYDSIDIDLAENQVEFSKIGRVVLKIVR